MFISGLKRVQSCAEGRWSLAQLDCLSRGTMYVCMYVVTITFNAYQGSCVYIDAYDADSSHTYMLTLAAEDIPALLVPNGSILSKGVLTQPTTPTEMYSQLLDLLHLEKSGNKRLQERWRNLNDTLHSKKTDFKGQLVIRRDYSFLRNCSTKMNGHRVLVKV